MIKTLLAFICLLVLVPCVTAGCDDIPDQTSCELATGRLDLVRSCNWCPKTKTCHTKGSILNKCGRVALSCGVYSSKAPCLERRTLGIRVCNWCDETSSCHRKGSLFNDCKSWVDCTDQKNIGGCLDAKKAGVRTCSWCIETGTCNAIGSLVNKCSTECCVSKARRSKCRNEENNPLYCYPDTGTQSMNIVLDYVDDGLSESQRNVIEVQRRNVLCFIKGALGKGNYEIPIKVETKYIDGVGGTLGQAGPRAVTTDPRNGYVRVLKGGMMLDTADLEALEKKGTLPDVILHEMLHVMGVGTLWPRNGCTASRSDCASQPYWNTETCPKAQEAYQSMGGKGAIPLADTGGPGTACAHWKESVFKDEVFTGYSSYKAYSPLSSMTVQSLADIGYVVDPQCTRVTQGNITIFAGRTTGNAYTASSMEAIIPTDVDQSEEWWTERNTIKSFDLDTSQTNPPPNVGTRSANPQTIVPEISVGNMVSPLALACIVFPILGSL